MPKSVKGQMVPAPAWRCTTRLARIRVSTCTHICSSSIVRARKGQLASKPCGCPRAAAPAQQGTASLTADGKLDMLGSVAVRLPASSPAAGRQRCGRRHRPGPAAPPTAAKASRQKAKSEAHQQQRRDRLACRGPCTSRCRVGGAIVPAGPALSARLTQGTAQGVLRQAMGHCRAGGEAGSFFVPGRCSQGLGLGPGLGFGRWRWR